MRIHVRNSHESAICPLAPTAAIFDCDGLLLDTTSAWHAAYEQVLDSDGRTLDDRLRAQLAGASVRSAARLLSIAEADLSACLHREFTSRPPRVIPGARALLDALAGKIPLAVATNAPRALIANALSRIGIAGYFDAILSAEALSDKPAPDVYLAAASAVGVEPGAAVAFEDSPVGAQSARAAGLTVVYVPSNGQGPAEADLTTERLDDPRVLDIFGLRRRSTRS